MNKTIKIDPKGKKLTKSQEIFKNFHVQRFKKSFLNSN